MKQAQKNNDRRDLYAEITTKLLTEMEQGVLPWRRPWELGNVAGGQNSLPQNAITGRPYNGMNRLLLVMSPITMCDPDPRWCTYSQAQEQDWQVRKGEKGTPVIFYKMLELRGKAGGREDDPDLSDGRRAAQAALSGASFEPEESDGPRRIPLLKTYTLFHASQIDGIPSFSPAAANEQRWTPVEMAERMVEGSGATILHGGNRAFYAPSPDVIGMPPRSAFPTAEAYYATQLHELGHWTGHESRLARPFGFDRASEGYAREELRAELASVFLGLEVGLEPPVQEAASYLSAWLKVLQNDKKEIFRAAADAQRATEYILRLGGATPDIEFDADEVSWMGTPDDLVAAAPSRRGLSR